VSGTETDRISWTRDERSRWIRAGRWGNCPASPSWDRCPGGLRTSGSGIGGHQEKDVIEVLPPRYDPPTPTRRHEILVDIGIGSRAEANFGVATMRVVPGCAVKVNLACRSGRWPEDE